jgi:dinuclear metal center YbgI/SA1388 family protein
MVRVKDILRWIDSRAPFRYAEPWDNCGLQVGEPESMVDRVLMALDPASSVVAEAVELGCECVVTHHPLLLHPIKSVRTDTWPGSVIRLALVSGISIIAAHTNLDAARQGTNDQLKNLLGLKDISPLEAVGTFSGEERYAGMGIIGSLPRKTAVRTLAETLSGALGRAVVRVVAGDLKKEAARVAVCAGSGASLMDKVVSSGAEVYVTGDFKYHDARLAAECGLAVIDIGHFASEKLVVEPFADFLRSMASLEAAKLQVFLARSEKDPFQLLPA